MAREFRLPDIGEGLTEAEIVRWLVPEGGLVAADEPVVEVETDKAVVEIPSPYAGVVLRHGGIEGETIAVGAVLVVIGEPDEVEPEPPSVPDVETKRPEPRPEPGAVDRDPPPESSLPDPLSAPIVGNLGVDVETLTPGTSTASAASTAAVKALPLVRKLARDNEVDLTAVDGSGPGGRITREDVEAAIRARPRSESYDDPEATETDLVTLPLQPAAVTEPAPADEQTGPPPDRSPRDGESPAVTQRDDAHGEAAPALGVEERHKMSRLRRTIATNMALSWSEIPHVTTFDDVDATRLLDVREALGARHGVKVPIEALVLKAVIPVLRAFPAFNSSIDGDDLIVHGSHDIGIAVDTPDGLLVAVIRDASSKSVLDLANEVRSLGEGGKERRLSPDQLGGQTFTVSNIGALGGGHGTPIVPHGTTAILSIGMAKDKPIARDGLVVVAPVMPLSLSYDHRVVDGGEGRRFMALLIENLEEPALFLAE